MLTIKLNFTIFNCCCCRYCCVVVMTNAFAFCSIRSNRINGVGNSIHQPYICWNKIQCMCACIMYVYCANQFILCFCFCECIYTNSFFFFHFLVFVRSFSIYADFADEFINTDVSVNFRNVLSQIAWYESAWFIFCCLPAIYYSDHTMLIMTLCNGQWAMTIFSTFQFFTR